MKIFRASVVYVDTHKVSYNGEFYGMANGHWLASVTDEDFLFRVSATGDNPAEALDALHKIFKDLKIPCMLVLSTKTA